MNNNLSFVAAQETALLCHPSTPCDVVCRITAEVQRVDDSGLRLRYCLAGDLAALCIPEAVVPRHGHELWNRTCFETFIVAIGAGHYYEFNFSPSREWAVYRLSAYRQGLTRVEAAQPAEISVARENGQLTLVAEIDLSQLPDLADAVELRLAVSAVVEDARQRRSYWALKHPSPAPDFHHPDGFTLNFPMHRNDNARAVLR